MVPKLSFDLADLRGYAYYSGAMFSVYAKGAADALARGGRYDEVGAVFGRNRPAVGFSLDVKALVGVAAPRPLRAAIRAPWGEAPDLRQAIASLRTRAKPWCVYCRATRVKLMSSTVIAS
jgi:ATP phosphoribosyltransferase regulatory subunit